MGHEKVQKRMVHNCSEMASSSSASDMQKANIEEATQAHTTWKLLSKEAKQAVKKVPTPEAKYVSNNINKDCIRCGLCANVCWLSQNADASKTVGACSGKDVGLKEGWWGLRGWGYDKDNQLPEVTCNFRTVCDLARLVAGANHLQ